MTNSFRKEKNLRTEKRHAVKFQYKAGGKTAKLRFKNAAAEWLTQTKLHVKPSTFANYTYLLRVHIIPYFGECLMTELSRQCVNSFICEKLTNGKLKKQGGLSKKYLRDILSIVKAVAAFCEQEHEIRDRIRYITSPKPEKIEPHVMNDEEYRALHETLKQEKSVYGLGVLVSMFTGLRLGEICGMKWGDFDRNEKTLTVRRTVQRISDCNGSTFLAENTPKTAASIRKIPLPQFVFDILCKFYADDEAPIVSECGSYTEPRLLRMYFYRTLKKAGIAKMRFHDLRHSFATKCIQLEFDIKSLSEILGHSNTAITLNRYVHSSLRQKREHMEKLAV